MMISENWSTLKREASTLESYVEQRLQSREPPAPAAGGGAPLDVEHGGAAGDARLVRLTEIDESLGKLAGVVDRLGALATASASAANLVIAQVRDSFFLSRAFLARPTHQPHSLLAAPSLRSASATCWAACARSTARRARACASA